MQLLSKPWRFALAAIMICASIPASATMWKWSQTAATNSSSDSTINWAEGQAPSSVNDSARAVMAAIAKYRDDVSGSAPSNAILEVGGTSTAYTLTSNQTITANTNGFTVTFRVGSGLTNGAAVTLAVDSQTARAIQGINGTNLTGGELVEGSTYTVTYFATAAKWLLHNFYYGSPGVPPASIQAYAGTTAPSGYLLAYGQCVSRTTYAALFAIISTTYPGTGACTGSEFGIPDLRGRVIAGQDDMGGGGSANRLQDAGSDSLNGDTLGDTGGAETETLSEAELDAHSHSSTGLDLAGHSHDEGSLAVSGSSHTHSFSDSDSGDVTFNDSSWVDSVSSGSNVADGGGGLSVITSVSGNTGTLTGSVSIDISGTTGSANPAHTISGNTGSADPAVSGDTADAGSGTAFAKVQPTIILNYIIKF
jgi:microcystin-dependent protein